MKVCEACADERVYALTGFNKQATHLCVDARRTRTQTRLAKAQHVTKQHGDRVYTAIHKKHGFTSPMDRVCVCVCVYVCDAPSAAPHLFINSLLQLLTQLSLSHCPLTHKHRPNLLVETTLSNHVPSPLSSLHEAR